MKFIIPITFALFSFGFSVSAQTSDGCAVNDCTPFLQLVQDCGINPSTAPADYVLTPRQASCICGGRDSKGIISTCVTCLNRSNELDSRYDTFTELCPSDFSSGSRSCSVFRGAPYMVGGLMAGMGFFGMAI